MTPADSRFLSRRRFARTWLAGAAAAALAACGGSGSRSDLRFFDRAALRQQIEALADDMLVPGTVVLLRTPRGDFDLAYGTTSYRGTTPVDASLHIRVGSVTKTWTATAILQLVQEGRLALGDPVSAYRPEVPNGDHITIEQLLTMRSGLFNYTELLEVNQAMDDDPGRAWAPEALVALGLAQKPYFEPGQGYHYANTNTLLLGLIVEQLDGKPLAQSLQERVFARAGMTHTLLPAADSTEIPAPFSRGYMYGDNVLTMGSPPALPADLQAAARAGTLAPVDQTNANPSWAGAAGAGISTAGDLLAGVRAMVASTTLLNADMQARRLASVRPANPDVPSAQYGWGIAKFGPLYGHTGELPGYNTFMGHDPDNDVTLIVWTNLGPVPDGRAAATTIAKRIIDSIYRDMP